VSVRVRSISDYSERRKLRVGADDRAWGAIISVSHRVQCIHEIFGKFDFNLIFFLNSLNAFNRRSQMCQVDFKTIAPPFDVSG